MVWFLNSTKYSHTREKWHSISNVRELTCDWVYKNVSRLFPCVQNNLYLPALFLHFALQDRTMPQLLRQRREFYPMINLRNKYLFLSQFPFRKFPRLIWTIHTERLHREKDWIKHLCPGLVRLCYTQWSTVPRDHTQFWILTNQICGIQKNRCSWPLSV